MRWYYFGMGFRSVPTHTRAKKLAKQYGRKYKVVKIKDPIGGFMYKVYFNKRIYELA